MNDIRRLNWKIANLHRQKRQRRLLIIVIGILAVGLALTIDANKNLENEARNLRVVYASEVKEGGQAPQATSQVMKLTESERELVERVVAAEARGESFEGQMAVAQVIRDRSLVSGQAVTEILSAENQFAKSYDGEISSTTEAAVGFVFEGGHNIFEVPVTHFYSHDLISKPDWAKELVFVDQIGGHSFYTEAEYAAS